jgi:hypothetical protein
MLTNYKHLYSKQPNRKPAILLQQQKSTADYLDFLEEYRDKLQVCLDILVVFLNNLAVFRANLQACATQPKVCLDILRGTQGIPL